MIAKVGQLATDDGGYLFASRAFDRLCAMGKSLISTAMAYLHSEGTLVNA